MGPGLECQDRYIEWKDWHEMSGAGGSGVDRVVENVTWKISSNDYQPPLGRYSWHRPRFQILSPFQCCFNSFPARL
jgi:hypothetical protein